MNFITLLRKLGILRYGKTKGVYHNAKEIPTGLFMGDAFDDEKDLIHKSDFKRKGKKRD
jgi:hypothetical protein